jgi:hypothetical protein
MRRTAPVWSTLLQLAQLDMCPLGKFFSRCNKSLKIPKRRDVGFYLVQTWM